MNHFRGYLFVYFLVLSCLFYGLALGALSQTRLDELCKGYSLQTIAHPDGTQKFIFCTANGGSEKACPPGTCFNLSISVCAESSDPCKITTPVEDEVSKDDCNSKDFLMKKIPSKNCQSYYICSTYDMAPIKAECPLLQHYSKSQEKCVDLYEAECQPKRLWCDNLMNGTKLKAEQCYQYYECSDGKINLQTCMHYQYFNGTKCVRGSCSDKNGVSSMRKPNCLDKEGEYFPHSQCNMYYVCHNNIPFEVQCPNEFFYDENLKKCIRDLRNECY